jgi:hypothetical protein
MFRCFVPKSIWLDEVLDGLDALLRALGAPDRASVKKRPATDCDALGQLMGRLRWALALALAQLILAEEQQLHRAARDGQLDQVVDLIRKGALVDERAAEVPWWSALHLAASRRRSSVVRALLEAGADANLRDGDGRTALMLAATAGLEESLDALISAGADINAQDAQGESALWKATSRGHAGIVRRLLASGAVPDTHNYACVTAMQLAVTTCKVCILLLLLLHATHPPGRAMLSSHLSSERLTRCA